MRQAVIVEGVRTAVGKAPRGTLKNTRPDYLGKLVVEDVVKRLGPDFDKSSIDDVIMATSFPEGPQGMNVARVIALYSGLPETVPGLTINRFCCGGLQSISLAAERIMVGGADIIIAGGTESMTMLATKITPDVNGDLLDECPDIYLGMGLTAENVANKFKISRQEQDEFALESNIKAARAIKEGAFDGQITPVPVKTAAIGPDNKAVVKEKLFTVDEGYRENATMETLGKLRPAFSPTGSVTAGNSSQTSDGAGACVVMSEEKAKELGMKPRLKYIGYSVAACPPGLMGIGPLYAIPKVLKQTGMSLKDIGLIELNEAFASQSCYVIKELGLNKEVLNVNGGAIALGHPLGATGAKLTVQIMHEMEKRKVKYGMVTMCVGGGQGAAGIFELVP